MGVYACLIPMHNNVKLLANMDLEEGDPTIYRKIVGKLIHLTIVKQNFSYLVGVVNQFMN
jgi:hypothetical protein